LKLPELELEVRLGLEELGLIPLDELELDEPDEPGIELELELELGLGLELELLSLDKL
jgi:hypothetical protein